MIKINLFYKLCKMKRIKHTFLPFFLFPFILFVSCDPKIFDCNYTEMIYVENKTDTDVIYEITFVPIWGVDVSANDDSLLYYYVVFDDGQNYPDTVIGINAAAQNGMQYFLSVNDGTRDNWGSFDRCNSWNHFDHEYRQHIVYNLKDTSSYIIEDPPYNSDFFTRPYPQENGDLSQINSFCLIISDSLLGLMDKDTSMLTTFADYYSQQ